jgi:phage-related minor tail protein
LTVGLCDGALAFITCFWYLAVAVAAVISLDSNNLETFWCLWVWITFLDCTSDFAESVTSTEVTGITGFVPGLSVASAFAHLIDT